MNTYEQDPTSGELETVALAGDALRSSQARLASQVVAPAKRDASNWKWMGRSRDAPMKYVALINDQQYEIEIDNDGIVLVDGEVRDVDFLNLGGSLYSLITENKSFEAGYRR